MNLHLKQCLPGNPPPRPAPCTDRADGCTPVAQTSSLLYRGFPIRRPREGWTPLKVRMRCLNRTPSRLEVGDTAGWKPALPGNGRSAGKAAFRTWVAQIGARCGLHRHPGWGDLTLGQKWPRTVILGLLTVFWLVYHSDIRAQTTATNPQPAAIKVQRVAFPPMRTNAGAGVDATPRIVRPAPAPAPGPISTPTPPPATARQPQALDPLQDLMMTQPAIDVRAPVSVVAQFEPATVNLGERLTYRLEISALSESVQLPSQLPTPPQLKAVLSARGQYFSSQGAQLQPHTSVNYRISATTAGEFVIPPYSLTVYGQTVAVPAARVKIINAPSAPPGDEPRLITKVAAGEVFVGQALPVTLTLLFPLTTNILGVTQVQTIGQAFIHESGVNRVKREMVPYVGKSWNAYICELVVTPINQGSHTLLSQMQAYVNQPFNNQPGAFSMNQVLFDGDPLTVEVKPLPKEGELPGFTGAIGLFQLDPPQLSVSEVRVGEPITLTVIVKGVGNINRLVPPRVLRAAQWQVFPPLTDAFAPVAPANQMGLRSISYTLIPLAETAQATPAIPFCYFNPQTKRYVDLTFPPVKIKVTPNPAGRAQSAATGQPAITATDPYPRPADEEPLVLTGLAEIPGPQASTLAPWQQQPWFLWLQWLPAALLAGLWWWDQRRGYLAAHPELRLKRRARRGLRREMRRLRRAASAQDLPAFLRAATQALREACAPRTAANPAALVGDDILSAMAQAGFPRSDQATVKRIFAAADGFQFRGQATEAEAWFASHREIENILISLKNKL